MRRALCLTSPPWSGAKKEKQSSWAAVPSQRQFWKGRNSQISRLPWKSARPSPRPSTRRCRRRPQSLRLLPEAEGQEQEEE